MKRFILLLAAAIVSIAATPTYLTGWLDQPPGWTNSSGCFFVENKIHDDVAIWVNGVRVVVMEPESPGGEFYARQGEISRTKFVDLQPAGGAIGSPILYGNLPTDLVSQQAIVTITIERYKRVSGSKGFVTSTSNVIGGVVKTDCGKTRRYDLSNRGTYRLRDGDPSYGCVVVKAELNDLQACS